MLVTCGEIIDYEYKMCLHSKPEFILDYQVTQVPGGFEYRFCEENLKPLWSVEAPTMTSESLGQLLLAFVGMVNSCKEYLLDFNHIGLEGEDFSLRENGMVGFCYRPFTQTSPEPLKQRLEAWLALVHQHVDYNSEESLTMLHPLSIAMASESLSLRSFAEVILSSTGKCYE